MNLHPDFIRMATGQSDMYCVMPLIHQMTVELATRTSSCCIAELGVRGGNSTISFLAALAQTPTNGHLHSCDIDPCLGAHATIPADLKAHWTFTQCDSVAFADQFAERSVNMLFIDTDHTYALTKAELYAWVTRLALGARILLHDTCVTPEGVGRAISEFLASYTNARYYNIDVYAGLGVITMP